MFLVIFMLKAVIFDLDGTILNTISDLCNSCNFALNKYNKDSITIEEASKFLGNGIKKLCERALKGNLEYLDEVYKEMLNHYYKNYNVCTTKYDYIDDIIKLIKDKNLLIGIISNKKEEVLKKLVKEQFGDVFDFVIGDSGIRKPDPYNINKISDLYNIKNNEILYIGDSNVDIETVKNAKCKGAYVSYGYRSYDDMKKLGAEPLFKSSFELYQYMLNYLQ